MQAIHYSSTIGDNRLRTNIHQSYRFFATSKVNVQLLLQQMIAFNLMLELVNNKIMADNDAINKISQIS